MLKFFNIFIEKKMNEINLNLDHNENSLSFYVKNLTKIYNATLNQFESGSSDNHDDLTGKDNASVAFRQCKEKAFDYLMKAKSLDKMITNQSRQNECLFQTKEIDDLVNNYQNNRQNQLNRLINLHKEYEISSSLIKQKLRRPLGGLDTQIQLDSILSRIISSDSSFLSVATKSNVLFYGASGCGKMSWIIHFMLRHRLITLAEHEEGCVFKKVKPFLIDFRVLLEKDDTHVEIIETLMKSISLCIGKENIHAIIILKNVELLFQSSINEKLSQLKDRFVCNLVEELDSNTVDYEQHGISNSRFFILLSERPWLLHPTILYK